MKKILILILFITCHGYAQPSKTDSLFSVLKTQKEDTAKVNTLNDIAFEFRSNNPDTALYFANEAMALATKLNYKMGIADAYLRIGKIIINMGKYEEGLKNSNDALRIYDELLISEKATDKSKILMQKANAYNNIGNVYNEQGNYPEALNIFFTSLEIRKQIGYKLGMAVSYGNIGVIYNSQGNYPEALKNDFAGLKIYEEIGDKKGVATTLNNIGNIYFSQGNYPEALKNHFSSLKISEEIGEKKGMSGSYHNIGNIYLAQGNYPEALKNYFTALSINKEIGNKAWEANNLANIGIIYNEQGNYPESLKNQFAALKIKEEIGDKNGIASSYINLGNLYIKQKKYNEASESLKKSLSLAKEIGSLAWTKESYSSLAKLDSAQGNFKQAFEHHKLFIAYRDSLVNEENTKKLVQTQMQYDFDKKEAATKADQEKKDAVALKEVQKQKIIRNSFIGAFATVFLFAIIFFVQRNKISKERKRSDALLLNILPAETAKELKAKGSADAKLFDDVTVMFTDFKDFTQISEKLSPADLVAEIHYCFKAFDNIMTKFNIEKIKTIGDSYMAAGGLPVENKTNAEDMVLAALEIQKFMQQYKQEKQKDNQEYFEIRIGIHTGPVVAGIVGIKKYSYDIWGDTVNIASRMESTCEPGKVNISESTYLLVQNKFNCIHRGKVQAKNKGEVDMYFVEANV